MLEIDNLEKSFGSIKVLHNLRFTIPRAQITGVAGPNACGKTTLLKCILGLTLPDRGSISLGGRRIKQDCAYRRGLGYMPQFPDFPPHLSPKELFRMIEDLRREPSVRKAELVSYFEIEPYLNSPFGKLSGGTKQKVAAVLALMFDAPLLILDEPTAGLDPLSTIRFKDLLAREVANGKTAILVTHAMTELDQLASHLIYMTNGYAALTGTTAKLKELSAENDLGRAIIRLITEKGKFERIFS